MILSSDKKVIFRSKWLPWVLIAPQGFIILAFFFWPAGQALVQSFQQSDAFGTSVQWSGLDNFVALWRDETYLESFKTTALFSVLVAGLGISLSLVLAFFADRVVRGIWLYRSLLILPYAVAPVVAGVLWLFLFSPSVGLVAYVLEKIGIEWNILLNSTHAMTLVVIASVWKQISYNFLFFLAGLQSIPRSLIEAAIGGSGNDTQNRVAPDFGGSTIGHGSCPDRFRTGLRSPRHARFRLKGTPAPSKPT